MEDFFDELEELALGSRLKRLSDRMYAEAQSVYKNLNIPVQPKWFSLLALLYKKERISVVEAADSLQLSQPALSQFCKQLIAEGLAEFHSDKKDSRKRIIALTPKGWVTISNLHITWKGIERAAQDLCKEADNDFYQSLVKFEHALSRQSLLERSQSHLALITDGQQVEFIPFQDNYAPYFDVINTEWIESMFTLEEIDKQVLRNPKQFIIEPGGHIWFAKHPLYGIVGACALLKSGENEYELTKMGVLSTVRGLKIGEALLIHVLHFATKTLNADSIYLLTNRKCEAAIHLYEKLGFIHSKEIMRKYGSHYERCNVAMNLTGIER
ncbi:GNAT family N-acetyltransferase [Alteromonas sediminis]|uniref:GNAT family N-acetyltransferase n=1 Tax=Alteromonas sediminis TaxID=2259342 RepID=A0A3N5Y9D4_9ALTE|nr:GNAT family N-acetyltransferase [Alteromonas sediminis]RPJ67839.1 GNAT family N-acetyltransferase [Alteromonas sediminis]